MKTTQINAAMARDAITRAFKAPNPAFDRLKNAVPDGGIDKPGLMRLADQHLEGEGVQKLKAMIINALKAIDREKAEKERQKISPSKEDIGSEFIIMLERSDYPPILAAVYSGMAARLLNTLWKDAKFRNSLKGVPASEVVDKLYAFTSQFAEELQAEASGRSFGTPEIAEKLIVYLSKTDDPWTTLQKLNQLYGRDIKSAVRIATSTNNFERAMNVILKYASNIERKSVSASILEANENKIIETSEGKVSNLDGVLRKILTETEAS